MFKLEQGMAPKYSSIYIYSIVVVSLIVLCTLSYQLYQSKHREAEKDHKIQTISKGTLESQDMLKKINTVVKNEKDIASMRSENEVLRSELSEKYHIIIK